MWVLTEEYNEYNQYGQYFIMCWKEKPDYDELYKYIEEPTIGRKGAAADMIYVKWLHDTGGGRAKLEDNWYNFYEVGE